MNDFYIKITVNKKNISQKIVKLISNIQIENQKIEDPIKEIARDLLQEKNVVLFSNCIRCYACRKL